MYRFRPYGSDVGIESASLQHRHPSSFAGLLAEVRPDLFGEGIMDILRFPRIRVDPEQRIIVEVRRY